MAMSSFCGLLSVQVGIIVLAAVFFTLGSVVLVANVFETKTDSEDDGGDGGGGGGDGGGQSKALFLVKKEKSDEGGGEEEGGDEENEADIAILLIVAFAISLFVVGGLAFFSAYSEARGLAMAALLTLVLLGAFWALLSVLSILSFPKIVEMICKEKRCPETFWLARLDYRKDNGDGSEGGDGDGKGGGGKGGEKGELAESRSSKLSDSVLEINETYASELPSVEFNAVHNTSNRLNVSSGINDFMRLYGQNIADEKPKKKKKKGSDKGGDEEDEKESKYKFGLPFFAAIGLFIANLIFFLYSALTLYSWYQDLNEVEYYVEEPYFVGPYYY